MDLIFERIKQNRICKNIKTLEVLISVAEYYVMFSFFQKLFYIFQIKHV